MRRIDARRKNASALQFRFSQSLASRRHRLSHAMVRSTIHRFGSTMKVCNSLRLTISTTQLPERAAASATRGGGIREDALNERKQGSRPRIEQECCAVA